MEQNAAVNDCVLACEIEPISLCPLLSEKASMRSMQVQKQFGKSSAQLSVTNQYCIALHVQVQKQFGKCDAEFMKGYCKKTCGRC